VEQLVIRSHGLRVRAGLLDEASDWSPPDGVQGGRVLVVDDDEDVRMLLARYLAMEGFDVDHASDVDSALLAIRRLRPDLVLLDIMMPGRDGLDLLGHLRREGDLE
jgi:CheY-like chemotaxis protein